MKVNDKSISITILTILGFVGKAFAEGTYKSGKVFNTIWKGWIPWKSDLDNGSFVNGVEKPILSSFSLDNPPAQKVFQIPKSKQWRSKILKCWSKLLLGIAGEKDIIVNFNSKRTTFTVF